MPNNQDDTLLIFRIDCIPCAVPAASVQTIVMPPEHLTQPPGSNRALPGIFRHAEHVYAVVDLRQRFGIDSPRKGAGRLLLHEDGMRRHALWVDEVVGLVRSEEGQWAQLPPYLPRELFHGGFLYNNEIVLYSTLAALLTMLDAGPIRRHWESLRQMQLPQEDVREEPKTAPPAPPPGKPKEPKPPTVTEERPAQSRNTVVAKPARPRPPKPRPITPRTTPKKVIAPRPAAKPRPRPVSTPPPPPVVQPQAPTPTPQPQGTNQLLWIVLILLLLGGLGVSGYLFLGKAEKPKQSPTHYSKPAPAITETRPVESLTPPQARITLPPVEPTPPTPTNKGAAIQIEQNEEGTISLIIERDRLRQPPRQATDELEEPLQPNPDWPQPAALPEPCDCTHIVVKGDTLWAIAQQYTNNAYNYPELARQSGIRNPHRIYPGNKVRIIVR